VEKPCGGGRAQGHSVLSFLLIILSRIVNSVELISSGRTTHANMPSDVIYSRRCSTACSWIARGGRLQRAALRVMVDTQTEPAIAWKAMQEAIFLYSPGAAINSPETPGIQAASWI